MPSTLEKRRARDRRLKAQYNISIEDYETIFEYQGRVCPICKRDKNRQGKPYLWGVDHNHKTGLTRGILCYNCNRKLVEFWTIDTAANALEYLTRPPVTVALGGDRYGKKGRVTTKRRSRRPKKRGRK